ncbi:hypothetical protein IGI04_022084 [Brassica rapa subsp. trilocularis]|uniref:TRF2/HOY1 PH-like domain-containing protein n=1 Tax=Brassica rapa subsp. trilocularis TaxID=1813537 RepID=A0ABQ7M448_BRACM|nr:hypothetical protein IGI04_022084 [Brassica rapa subsp. trilocularis]
MERSREELEASNNGGSSPNKITGSVDEQVENGPLNLRLTTSPEFLKQIESLLQQQQQDSNSTPPAKTKPMSFPISKITIGEWTRDAVYEQDLKAKIYFARKKIMWECVEDVSTTGMNRKIEMQWGDVLSLKPWYHPHDQTGILKVELRKPPTFFIETNPQARKHTQWQQLDQDFTRNHSASRNRIHTLHFAPGVLQKNMEKLVSGDRFWSELVKVHFPTLEHLYFYDIGYGNSMNNMHDGNRVPR